MRGTALFLAVAVGVVAAQTSTAPSGCGTSIDLIIQNCLGTQNTQLKMCKANDWDCLCEQQSNVLVCYNNCPTDPSRFGAEQQQVSWCNAAKAYGKSASSSLTASVTPSSTVAQAAVSAPASTTPSSSTSPSTVPTDNAAPIVAPVTGVLAVVLGFAALL